MSQFRRGVVLVKYATRLRGIMHVMFATRRPVSYPHPSSFIPHPPLA